MLDDLCFYIQTHGTRLQIDGPELVYALSAKIIASHYTLLAEFIENIFLNTNFKMSRQANLSRFDTFVVESQWSDVHAYYILVWRFLSRLESIMLQLRVPFGEPDTSQHPAWTDIRVDFNTLHMKFRRLQQGVELLNASITGLASIAGNRQALTEQKLSLAATERSIREARSAKALTFVGLVFIPLAYMASLFSMSDPYGPGGGKFWLYFVISLPLVVVVVSSYYVLDLGYGPEGKNWSFANFTTAVKETVRQYQRYVSEKEDEGR